MLASLNVISKEIGDFFKSGKREEAEKLKSKTVEIKEQTKALELKLKDSVEHLTDALTHIPNAPCSAVPNGKTPEDNEIIFTHGAEPVLEQSKPHWDLCEEYDLIDFELGVKIAGAGFLYQ